MEKFDKTNPYNPNKQSPVELKRKKILIGIIFIGIVLFVIKCTCGSEEKKKTKTYEKIDALTHAQLYVKSKLKSPSSAEFEYGLDGVTKINDTVFKVTGTVDSQNSFGAMLRTNYACEVIFHPKTDTHDIVNVILQ